MKAGLPNLAATLGGWSARHRLAAVGAWLALVVATVLIGSAVGQMTMTQAEYGVGESGQATWALVNAVAVFAVFATLSVAQFKQLAVGLAFSVLIDATVIRAVLLPSVMALLGDRNWYLPRWLSGFTAGGGGPRPQAGPPAPLTPRRAESARRATFVT